MVTALDWDHLQRLPEGMTAAHGEDWTYLITYDDQVAVLTRFRQGPHYWEVARQAALYALQLGDTYGIPIPETIPEAIMHLKQAAQLYENGTGITGWPAWQHTEVPAP